MRVLMVHNYYSKWGGEDQSTEQEISLLRASGCEVETYTRHNREIDAYSMMEKARLFQDTSWSTRTYQEIQMRVRAFQPDIVHVQNFFPLISPAVFHACADVEVPVVASLRNYRLLCPNSTFFRDGHICEDCLTHKSLWPSLLHRCYRDSVLQTATVATMIHQHRIRDTWHNKVDKYIALSKFTKQKMAEGGLPDERIVVRPNFLADDPGVGEGAREYAICVGRLSPEKGVLTLVEAWQEIPQLPLKIVGDGPLAEQVRTVVAQRNLKNVEVCGFVAPDQVISLIMNAALLVMPSECYETFGRSILEAFATGTPVLASRLGAMAEVVQDDYNGKHFTPGDAQDLARKANELLAQPERLAQLGRNGRKTFEERYSAKAAYASIRKIYEETIQHRQLGQQVGSPAI